MLLCGQQLVFVTHPIRASPAVAQLHPNLDEVCGLKRTLLSPFFWVLCFIESWQVFISLLLYPRSFDGWVIIIRVASGRKCHVLKTLVDVKTTYKCVNKEINLTNF